MTVPVQTLAHVALLLLMPPLLPGIIAKTKAWFAGRQGPPILQSYYDVWKLLQKGAVYSRTTTWVFRAGPAVTLATVLLAGLVLPLHSGRAPLAFSGDVILFAYLLGLGRFFTMAAAMDTGSSFEGMGASREATFSAVVEPALLLALAIICIPAHTVSFEAAWAALSAGIWGAVHPAYLGAALALFVVLLAENSRIPIDDPNTHLELTMVHEVMVLDHGGPDFAFVLYAGAMKLFIFAALVIHVLVPIPANAGWAGMLVFIGGELILAVAVGAVESMTARLRLVRVPQFLLGATVIAAIGLVAMFYRGEP